MRFLQKSLNQSFRRTPDRVQGRRRNPELLENPGFRIARRPEHHAMQGFAKIPLDILLLTREEVISNFRNHNPLFLDIAVEGLILLDPEELLSGLMSETKNYIRTKGIRRFGDGWIFPVRKGVAVPL